MEFKQHRRHEFHLNFLATEFTLQGGTGGKREGEGAREGPGDKTQAKANRSGTVG